MTIEEILNNADEKDLAAYHRVKKALKGMDPDDVLSLDGALNMKYKDEDTAINPDTGVHKVVETYLQDRTGEPASKMEGKQI